MKKLIFVLFCCILFFSCKNKNEQISFLDDDTLSLDPTIKWAVVIEPDVAFRAEPSWQALSTDHSRYGDVLMIEGCKILDSNKNKTSKEIWYRFEHGWLAESSISIYQNQLKAKKASSLLLK